MFRGRFPKQHRFPGGFTVEIVEQDRHPGSKHPDHILDAIEDRAAYQTLSYDRGRIILWSGLTLRQKWIELMHEMTHAMVDAQNYVSERLK